MIPAPTNAESTIPALSGFRTAQAPRQMKKIRRVITKSVTCAAPEQQQMAVAALPMLPQLPAMPGPPCRPDPF